MGCAARLRWSLGPSRGRWVYPDHARLESLVARQGIDGFFATVEARRACCGVRKVEPLRRALAGAAAWITGLRADQSDERAGISFAAVDPNHRLIKVSPLFDWTRDWVLSFIREHDIPYNSLHDRGVASIGCAPCAGADIAGLSRGPVVFCGRTQAWTESSDGPVHSCAR